MTERVQLWTDGEGWRESEGVTILDECQLCNLPRDEHIDALGGPYCPYAIFTTGDDE